MNPFKSFIKRSYYASFDMRLGDQEKVWASTQDMHRVPASVNQGQEEVFKILNSHGLERTNTTLDCYFFAIDLILEQSSVPRS